VAATARRDLVVIGASSGGLGALSSVLRGLPAKLPAAVVAVIHHRPEGRNFLVDILNGVGALPAVEVKEGMPLEPARIYVPPLDHHVLVEPGHLRLSRGPKENYFRPAIDPLFRSASRSRGAGTVGVVLSGTLDDGTAGLMAVKRRQGLAVVQDPESAQFPQMPRNALEYVQADHILPPEQIGALLARVAGTPVPASATAPVPNGEVQVQERGDADMELVESLGRPSHFSCPECNGVLWEIHDDNLVRYRCHTGHAYGPQSLNEGKAEAVETALWSAIRALKEKLELTKRIGDRALAAGRESDVRRAGEQAEFMERQIFSLRELLERL
jgi:two-component system chemotaxis response regulator CheB